MQLNSLLRIVFLILDMIAFMIDLLNNTRIELSIPRENGLAMSALLEQLSVRLL